MIYLRNEKKEFLPFFIGKQAKKHNFSNNVRELSREKDIVTYTFSRAIKFKYDLYFITFYENLNKNFFKMYIHFKKMTKIVNFSLYFQ